MPYCPICHEEYESRVKRCSACRADLVDSPQVEMAEVDPEAIALVELAGFSNVCEAEMIREILERNGLPTVQRGEADPIGIASGAESITLLVEKRDFQRARELYEAYFSDRDRKEPPPEPN